MITFLPRRKLLNHQAKISQRLINVRPFLQPFSSRLSFLLSLRTSQIHNIQLRILDRLFTCSIHFFQRRINCKHRMRSRTRLVHLCRSNHSHLLSFRELLLNLRVIITRNLLQPFHKNTFSLRLVNLQLFLCRP